MRKIDEQHKSTKSIFTTSFWITIAVLIIGTLILASIAFWRFHLSPDQSKELAAAKDMRIIDPKIVQKLIPSIGSKLIADATNTPFSKANQIIDQSIDRAFAPVYARIPMFTNRHYSVIGEYTELYLAASGGRRKLENALASQLFAELDPRLRNAWISIITNIKETVQKRIQEKSDATHVAGIDDRQLQAALGDYLKQHLEKLFSTQEIAVHLAVSASGATIGAAIAAPIAGKLLIKLGAKLAAKTAAKTAGSTGAAATGAGFGAMLGGPIGAAVGGVVGGVVGWIGTDAAVISVDEWLNKDEFEQELRRNVNIEKTKLKNKWRNQLKNIRKRMHQQAMSIAEKTPAQIVSGSHPNSQ